MRKAKLSADTVMYTAKLNVCVLAQTNAASLFCLHTAVDGFSEKKFSLHTTLATFRLMVGLEEAGFVKPGKSQQLRI